MELTELMFEVTDFEFTELYGPLGVNHAEASLKPRMARSHLLVTDLLDPGSLSQGTKGHWPEKTVTDYRGLTEP